MHIVSDSKSMEMQLLNQHGGPRSYFVEVIKYSPQVYGSLDHFRQMKIGGEMLTRA